jgi:hemerythrin
MESINKYSLIELRGFKRGENEFEEKRNSMILRLTGLWIHEHGRREDMNVSEWLGGTRNF